MPNTVSAKLKELEAARAKLASLEEAVRDEMKQELASLPQKYGFDSVEAFLGAVREAAGGRRGRRKGAKPGRAAGRRQRAKITDETRAQVKKLVESGKTGAEIAQTLGISLPSVQNIKKALGLVKKR